MEYSGEIATMIRSMVQKYPNDYKLGEAVREYVNKLYVSEIIKKANEIEKKGYEKASFIKIKKIP